MEVYSGASSVHIGLRMQALPALLPWDRELDGRLDVCKNGIVLIRLAMARKIFFAMIETPCRSNILARDPPLRSWEDVYGKSGLSPSQRHLVPLGNLLADFGLWLATELHVAGA